MPTASANRTRVLKLTFFSPLSMCPCTCDGHCKRLQISPSASPLPSTGRKFKMESAKCRKKDNPERLQTVSVFIILKTAQATADEEQDQRGELFHAASIPGECIRHWRRLYLACVPFHTICAFFNVAHVHLDDLAFIKHIHKPSVFHLAFQSDQGT